MLTTSMAHAEPTSASATTTTPSPILTQQERQERPHQPATPPPVVNLIASHPVRRKTVYFTVGQRKEVAIFEDQTPSEEIKSLFSSAAEAGPEDILKMYTPEGSLVNISNRLESNRPDAPYRLELVAAHYNNGMLPEQLRAELASLDERVSDLERRMHDLASLYPQDVQAMRDELEQHKQILGLCRAGTSTFRHSGMGRPYWNRHKARRKSESEKRFVCEKYLRISTMTLTEEIRRCLRMPTFDNWQWEDEEILLLLQQMYIDLDLPRKFDIDTDVLRKFLCQVYMNYNEVPFHNFQHCFTVSQMMYGIIWCLDLPDKIGDLETLILLTSCICHDLDHPGFNNIYQINARTELALRYNDISPLENHHCSVAFNILEDTSANLFRSFPPDVYKTVREGIIRCILATDMARHNEILNQFNQIAPVFDYDNRAHINLLCMVLIKVSDISNEARPMDVAEPWLDCLLQEFFEQSDREKMEGLPVTPFMDRDKITKPSSQCSFIGFVLLPLFESIGRLYPELDDLIVNPVREALDYYRKLNEASRRSNLEQPTSPSTTTPSSAAPVSSLAIPDSSASGAASASVTTEETTSRPDQLQPVVRCADDDKKTIDHQQPPLPSVTIRQQIVAPPTTPISRERSLSQEEEIRRFSFGLDPDTFTEVEVCEKTFSFKISTDIRPLPGWSNGSGGGSSNGRQPSSAFRRASLAVMSASAESMRIRTGGAARSATNSPTHTAGPCGIAIVEEEEVELAIPKLNRATVLNGDVREPLEEESIDELSCSEHSQQQQQQPQQQQPQLQHNGAVLAPLASVEDVTDSLVPASAPVAAASVATAVATEAPACPSRSPARDNPILNRFRQWTDRFSLSPLRSSTPVEPPSSGGNGVGKGLLVVGGNESPTKSTSSSPRLGSRKVAHNLSRFFGRPCSRGGQQSSASVSPEPNQRPSSTCGASRPSRSAEISRKMSSSLDNVVVPTCNTDSTNHPPKNA